MGSQASKTSEEEVMADGMKASGSSQRSRQPSRRELPPDGDDSSEFMSADDDDDDEGGVDVSGINGVIRGTEDEIEMSSDSEDEEEEVDVGGLDGADETPLQRTRTDANTDLSAEDAWWAGLSSRTDETVARIMQSYGSQPSRSQEVAQDGDDGNEEPEENTLVVAQSDEDETQVVQDSMVFDTEQSPAMIGVPDQDSGHGSMAESEVGMLNADMETDDQEVHTAPETPNDWQPTNESQQDRIDAAEETVRRIQAERNGNAAKGPEQVDIPNIMNIAGFDAGSDMSSVKPAAVKSSTSQEPSQKKERASRRPSKKEKKDRKWRREQQKLGLTIQKSNHGDDREDPRSTTVGAVGPKKELISAEQYTGNIEKMNPRVQSNKGFKKKEGIADYGMSGGGTRVKTEEDAKNRDGDEVKESQIQCDSGTRNAEKRRVRREKRRAEREAAGRPKFNGHIEGKPKAEKNIKKKQRMKEERQADPNTVEGAKAAFREERKRKKKERRRAEIAARAGGVGVDGQGEGGVGLPVEA